MFLSETNGRNQNIKNNFSSLRYQAGDMKDDDDSDYEDYNSYFFRFGRALLSYDKNQMIKEANEKWSLEPCLEKKSPTKIRFSDDVNYVDLSDDEEIEENEFSDIEEDFVLFSQKLLNEIQSDLKKIPRKLETISETDVNANNEKDDKGKSNQSKESNLCLRENETKEKNIKIDLNVQNVTNIHRNDTINGSENTKPLHGILIDHSRTSIKNVTIDDHLGKKMSLKTLSKSEGVSVLPLNQKYSLHDGKNIKDTVLNGKHNPVKDHKPNLLMKFQKEVYDKGHKHKDVKKKIQNKNFNLDKPEMETQSNNLNSKNGEFNNVSIKNCFLNTNVKQDNQKVKKKPNPSTEELKNIPSSLMKVENISRTKQFSISKKFKTAQKSLQLGIVLNNESIKHTLDNDKISDKSTDINKKQTNNVDKLQTNNIITTSMKGKNVSSKNSIMKKAKSQILPEKQKINSKKTSLLLGKKFENILSIESKNVTNKLSMNKIPLKQQKQSIKVSVNINKNASNLNTTEKKCTSNFLVNSDEKSKQDKSVPAVTRVKSSLLELQNVPDRYKNNQSMNAAIKSKEKCPPTVKKTERNASSLRS